MATPPGAEEKDLPPATEETPSPAKSTIVFFENRFAKLDKILKRLQAYINQTTHETQVVLTPRVSELEHNLASLTFESAKFGGLTDQLADLQVTVTAHTEDISQILTVITDIDNIIQEYIRVHDLTLYNTLNKEIIAVKSSLTELIATGGEGSRNGGGAKRKDTQRVSIAETAPLLSVSSEEVFLNRYYMDWGDRAEDLASDDYVAYDDLIATLRVLRRQNFSVKAMRDEAIKMLDNIPICPSVASRHSRLPETLMVNITVGIVANMLQKLRSSFDAGERYLSDTAADKKMGSLDDAKVTTVKVVTRLLKIKRQHPPTRLAIFGIYNRESFETSAGITWISKS